MTLSFLVRRLISKSFNSVSEMFSLQMKRKIFVQQNFFAESDAKWTQRGRFPLRQVPLHQLFQCLSCERWES